MTNKTEAWAVVENGDEFVTGYDSEKDACLMADLLNAKLLATSRLPKYNVVHLVEETTNYKPKRETKWFVRSKKSEGEYYYWLRQKNERDSVAKYSYNKSVPENAQSFDTQEEAEKWVNPLNEAVLLEVKSERSR